MQRRSRLPLIFFIASVFVLGFGYGVSALVWKLWPHEIILDAVQAGQAYRSLQELRSRPRSLIDEPLPLPGDNPGEPIWRDASASTDDSWLLLAGGSDYHQDLCPDFGCLAWLMDRNGRVRHTWEVDPRIVWPQFLPGGEPPRTTAFNAHAVHLFDNGDLLVVYLYAEIRPVGLGVAMLDRNSKLLWSRMSRAWHWPAIHPETGHIYQKEVELIDAPLQIADTGMRLARCRGGFVREDWVRVLDRNGRLVWEFSVLDSLETAGLIGLLHLTEGHCDPTHLNYISFITPAAAQRMPGVRAGDLLLSMREINTLLAVHPRSGLASWSSIGRTIQQHNPIFLPDGRMLILDNLGGQEATGGTRVIRMDPADQSVETVFPRPGVSEEFLPIYTEIAGHLEMSADGQRVLFAESTQGRVIEFELESGRVTWAYANDHSWRGVDGMAEPSTERLIMLSAHYAGRPKFVTMTENP